MDLADLLPRAQAIAQRLDEPSLRDVINLSGVILHTGLGRARLAPEVAAQVARVAGSHAVVEFNLEDGRRGDRQAHVRELLIKLTGAESALVVNNCAGAVVLTLAAIGARGEVILSRGQMVEIGGAFRMPDIVAESGCRLVEVGCTNKTRLSDYASAISSETSLILRCHPSNFSMTGFVEQPSAADLARLAHEHGLWLIDDMGSGCLIDTRPYGLPPERTLRGALQEGADVVLASGDKLLGGPQAGLILGRAEAIGRIARHPLARALRIDKLTLAALEATLRMYAEGREREIPIWASLSRPLDEVRRWARRLARAGKGEVRGSVTEIGGGSAPGSVCPTWCAVLTGDDTLARELRQGSPALVGRVQEDAVWLDPRTLSGLDELRQAERRLREVVHGR